MFHACHGPSWRNTTVSSQLGKKDIQFRTDNEIVLLGRHFQQDTQQIQPRI